MTEILMIMITITYPVSPHEWGLGRVICMQTLPVQGGEVVLNGYFVFFSFLFSIVKEKVGYIGKKGKSHK